MLNFTSFVGSSCNFPQLCASFTVALYNEITARAGMPPVEKGSTLSVATVCTNLEGLRRCAAAYGAHENAASGKQPKHSER